MHPSLIHCTFFILPSRPSTRTIRDHPSRTPLAPALSSCTPEQCRTRAHPTPASFLRALRPASTLQIYCVDVLLPCAARASTWFVHSAAGKTVASFPSLPHVVRNIDACTAVACIQLRAAMERSDARPHACGSEAAAPSTACPAGLAPRCIARAAASLGRRCADRSDCGGSGIAMPCAAVLVCGRAAGRRLRQHRRLLIDFGARPIE